MKLKLTFLFILFAVTATAFAEIKGVPEAIDGTTRVNAEEVVALITEKSDLIVIDARKASDRDSSGWIEGSVGLPNTDTNPESLAKIIKDKNVPVLFYCNGVKCGRSVDSAKVAVSSGYKNVFWFRGGWEEWLQKGMPISRQ